MLLFQLFDLIGIGWGVVCALIIIALFGCGGLFLCLRFFGKKICPLICLSTAWYVLLVCLTIAKLPFFLFLITTILCIVVFIAGISIFLTLNSPDFGVTAYVVSWLAFLLFGVTIPSDDFFYYSPIKDFSKEIAVDWAINKTLTSNTLEYDFVQKIKNDTPDLVKKGVLEIYLGNKNEALFLFKKAQAEKTADLFLNEIIKYCEYDIYDKNKTLTISNKEGAPFAYVVDEKEVIETKKHIEKQLITNVFKNNVDFVNNYTEGKKVATKVKRLFIFSLLWGQFIAIPMIAIRIRHWW